MPVNVDPYWLIRMLKQIDYKIDALGRDQCGFQDWKAISDLCEKES